MSELLVNIGDEVIVKYPSNNLEFQNPPRRIVVTILGPKPYEGTYATVTPPLFNHPVSKATVDIDNDGHYSWFN